MPNRVPVSAAFCRFADRAGSRNTPEPRRCCGVGVVRYREQWSASGGGYGLCGKWSTLSMPSESSPQPISDRGDDRDETHDHDNGGDGSPVHCDLVANVM
jgi:hypothetical protein